MFGNKLPACLPPPPLLLGSMPAAAKRLLSSSSKAAASLPTAVIPKLNRSVTRIGFGAYRVSDKSHGQALRAAIQAGVNIVDTASNFENGNASADTSIKNQRVGGLSLCF